MKCNASKERKSIEFFFYLWVVDDSGVADTERDSMDWEAEAIAAFFWLYRPSDVMENKTSTQLGLSCR